MMVAAAERPAHSAGAGAILEVRDVVVRFGGIVALDGVSFDVPRGDIRGIEVLLGLFRVVGPGPQYRHNLFKQLVRILGRDFGYRHMNHHPLLEPAIEAMLAWWEANRANSRLVEGVLELSVETATVLPAKPEFAPNDTRNLPKAARAGDPATVRRLAAMPYTPETAAALSAVAADQSDGRDYDGCFD